MSTFRILNTNTNVDQLWSGTCLERLTRKLFSYKKRSIIVRSSSLPEDDFLNSINSFFNFSPPFIRNSFGIQKTTEIGENVYQIIAALRIMRDFTSLESVSDNIRGRTWSKNFNHYIYGNSSIESVLNSDLRRICVYNFNFTMLDFYLKNKDIINPSLNRMYGDGIYSAMNYKIQTVKRIGRAFATYLKNFTKNDSVTFLFYTYRLGINVPTILGNKEVKIDSLFSLNTGEN